MNDRTIRFVTVAPVFVFGVALVLRTVSGWSPLALAVAFLVSLPVLAAGRPRSLGWLLTPSVLLFAFVGLAAWLSESVPNGAAGDLVAGVLLGLPIWFLGVCVGSSESPGIAVLAYSAGLLEVVTLGTAVASLSGTPSPTSAEFLPAWFVTVGHQLGSLGSALSGLGLRTPVVFPLAGYIDPVFVGLAILGIGGLLLPMLRSEESGAAHGHLPSRRDLAAPIRPVPPPVLYASAEPPTPAVLAPGAGLLPVGGSVLAVAGFLLVGAVSPTSTFLVVTLGAAVALLLLFVFAHSRGARPAVTAVPVAARSPRR